MIPAAQADFVDGPETAAARLAMRRLARQLARSARSNSAFQPLVLCGPSGVGKTRLATDLVTTVIAGPAVLTAQMIPAHDLTPAPDGSPGDVDLDDLVTLDLLVIDDLQHLAKSACAGVAGLLDERNRRRLATVITLTGAPNRLPLPARLADRITAGLVVAIAPLSVSTRESIVRSIAGSRRIRLDDTAITKLARHGGGSLRPILGQLDSLAQKGRNRIAPITTHELASPHESALHRLDRILNRVAAHYGVSVTALRGPSRLSTVLLARQVAMSLARDVAQLPLQRIGAALGGRDHSTVLNSLKRLNGRMADDRALAATVRELKAQV
jgi:chromosomal replication initiator protein